MSTCTGTAAFVCVPVNQPAQGDQLASLVTYALHPDAYCRENRETKSEQDSWIDGGSACACMGGDTAHYCHAHVPTALLSMFGRMTILAEGAMTLPVTLSGGVLFAS